ncbi:MAG TPA: hypothetical protein VEB41_09055 [Burkholderiales bacterium]|nr:hypothetical protein [Burkholderiales bacterium]
MNALAAAAISAGELICEFDDGYRKSLLAALAGDPPRVESVLLYDLARARVLDSRRSGRKAILVRQDGAGVHFIEEDGPSFRVTSLTACTRGPDEACTRFAARHAWHFDRQAQEAPAGGAAGSCEPWRVD